MYCSIYVITNTVNGKKYVGQTKQKLSVRFTKHKKTMDEKLRLAKDFLELCTFADGKPIAPPV